MNHSKQKRIEELNRAAEKISKQYPSDYHRRQDFQQIVDQRSKLLQTGGGEVK